MNKFLFTLTHLLIQNQHKIQNTAERKGNRFAPKDNRIRTAVIKMDSGTDATVNISKNSGEASCSVSKRSTSRQLKRDCH